MKIEIEERIRQLEAAQAHYRKEAIIKKHAREFYLALVAIRQQCAEQSSQKLADHTLSEAGL